MPRGLGPVASWPWTSPVAPSTIETLLVASLETNTWSLEGDDRNVQEDSTNAAAAMN